MRKGRMKERRKGGGNEEEHEMEKPENERKVK